MSSVVPPDDKVVLSQRSVFVLIVVAAGAMAMGRLLSAEKLYEPSFAVRKSEASAPASRWPSSPPKPMPTFSSNDRSRWATVRALVEDNSFVVGQRDKTQVAETALVVLSASNALEATTLVEAGYYVRAKKSDSGIVFEDGWGTVDKVLRPGTLDFYSTKPPLLPVMVAGEYWVLHHWLGWNFEEHPGWIVRTILTTINVLPWMLYLWLLALMLTRYCQHAWTRMYILVAAAFGTMVTPFIITFNNHTIGTFCTLFALYPTLRIWVKSKESGWSFYLVAGFFAGFTGTCELPATAFTLGVLLLLMMCDVKKTLAAALPMALLTFAALVGTNIWAVGDWKPIYTHFGGPWYEYEGSHWAVVEGQIKRGIDWAHQHETRGVYAFHLLVGHHGLFSLMPIVILSFLGAFMGLGTSDKPTSSTTEGNRATLPRLFFASALLLSLVIVGFYLVKSTNYGGWSAGPRWLMWLTPIWMLSMIPVVDWLSQRRWGRMLAVILLGLSVMSMSYPAWNPWRHPWIYNFLDYRGLIPY